jgi:hypothetical protein
MKYLFLFLLFVTTSYAKLGDTEESLIEQHPEVTPYKTAIDNKSYMLLFLGQREEYAAGMLDGKCEIEAFSSRQDYKFAESFITDHIKQYSYYWIPINCPENQQCIAAMSEDEYYFAKAGVSKALHRDHVFWIFTDKWRQYCKWKLESI